MSYILKEVKMNIKCINNSFLEKIQVRLNYFIYNPLIVFILMDENFDIHYVNDVFLMNSEKLHLKYKLKFGDIFNCVHLKDSKANCGFEKQCINCKIRNSLSLVLDYENDISDITIDHKLNDVDSSIRFKLSINIAVVENRKWLCLKVSENIKLPDIMMR